jgi:hypothetical protein
MQKVDDLKLLQNQIISKHEAIRESANRLFTIDHLIRSVKEPVYDIPSAIDIISKGTYPRLPECMQLEVFFFILNFSQPILKTNTNNIFHKQFQD